MEVFEKKVLHKATKYPILSTKKSLRYEEQGVVNNENLPKISYKNFSEKTTSAIKKSFGTFEKQINQTRQYLAEFGNKIEKIYEKESYRNYLKEKVYQKIVKQLQNKKQIAQKEITQIKEESKKNFRGIIEQNERLEVLKDNYEQYLKKEQAKLHKLTSQLNVLTQKNTIIKEKIKSYWKLMVPCKEQVSQRQSSRKESVILNKEKDSIESSTINSKQNIMIADEKKSVYITNHTTHTSQDESIHHNFSQEFEAKDKLIMSSDRHFISKQHKRQRSNLLDSSLLPNCDLRELRRLSRNSSAHVYDDAIKQIQELQKSIVSVKRHASNEPLRQLSAGQQALRKQRIKQKIEKAQLRIQMMKLFIIYLKGNESTENRTGLENLRKIICYFEKIVQRKQNILLQVRKMGKNLDM